MYPATTVIYTYGHTLSLHGALPISLGAFAGRQGALPRFAGPGAGPGLDGLEQAQDRVAVYRRRLRQPRPRVAADRHGRAGFAAGPGPPGGGDLSCGGNARAPSSPDPGPPAGPWAE